MSWAFYDSSGQLQLSTDEGVVKQFVSVLDGAVASHTTQMVLDDTIPQNDEGGELMTLAITPKDTNSKLVIGVTVSCSTTTATRFPIIALFQDTTAGALAAGTYLMDTGGGGVVINFTHLMTAGTTSATTFKVRGGLSDSGTFTFNGRSTTREMGGVMASSITIWEVAA